LIGYVSAVETKEPGDTYLPNSVMRDMLQFLERQLGREALRGILNLAGVEHYFRGLPPNNMQPEIKSSDYLALIQGLRDYYDERGAVAVLRELGKANVRRGVVHAVGLAEQGGRITGKQLLGIALDAFAKSTAVRDRRLVLLQDSGDMLLVSVRQPACWAADGSRHACEVAVGALRGALEMVSGRSLRVRPIACCHSGAHHCVFEVSRAGRISP
jgi:predicted hydrocarbon binding protein